jgi:hypothetical protein
VTLDDLLALLPDNDTGAIDAADLRTIVTELWQQTAAGLLQVNQNFDALFAQVQEHETRIAALEAAP